VDTPELLVDLVDVALVAPDVPERLGTHRSRGCLSGYTLLRIALLDIPLSPILERLHIGIHHVPSPFIQVTRLLLGRS
jgi:hypothetical protein